MRVIEVNTLEPRLKTLTPWQSYTWKGFAGGEVKLYGMVGERSRDAAVMGFRETGERVQDSE